MEATAQERSSRLWALARAGARVQQLEPGPSPRLLCVTPPSLGAAAEQLDRAFDELRALSSREALRASLGIERGFRIEDIQQLVAVLPAASEPDRVRRWLERRLPGAEVQVEARGAATLTLAARFLAREGGSPRRRRYARQGDGRLRVEAFELHVTEHCNLRCANCCNISPLVPARTMTVDEVVSMCERMAEVLVADVFKIMGGEPLLHPELPAVLRGVRSSGIGDRVRLFTNGLRLRAMPDAFWEGLDELTISSYQSAPVRPEILALARARARRHDFVLNIKPVAEFSQVVSPRFVRDPAAVERTYQGCWLRHRCLIVRGGRFYMCTRAAYADEFMARVAHEPLPPGVVLDRSRDGEPLEGPDLAGRLERYMNRAAPLGACRYCFGGRGEVEPHAQLSRDDVRRGILSHSLTEPRWARR